MVFRSKRTFSRWILAASIGMAVVIGCAGIGAHAADDDEDDLLDVKIVRGVLKGLGLRKEEASIDYRERSPLVLPPGKDQLPPPEANAPKAANWPDDPDAKRVKQRKAVQANRKPYTEGVDDRPLLPNQYDNKSSGGSKGGEAPGRTTDETSRPSSPTELGTKGIFSNIGSIWQSKEEYTTFKGEPPRASLTEPPTGYRTPSPSQPYGLGKEKWTPEKFDRQAPSR